MLCGGRLTTNSMSDIKSLLQKEVTSCKVRLRININILNINILKYVQICVAVV
jgi:hypothetical protein